MSNINDPWAKKTQTPWPSQPETTSSDPRDKMTRDQLLVKWDELKRNLEEAKEAEMELRKYIVKRAFPEAKEGTNKTELGGGYELKAAIKFNYNLIPDVDKVEATLDKIAKVGNQGTFIADRLVNWKPNFLLTEYRKLQEAIEANNANEEEKTIYNLCNEMLVITEGAPILEIKEPKSKKK